MKNINPNIKHVQRLSIDKSFDKVMPARRPKKYNSEASLNLTEKLPLLKVQTQIINTPPEALLKKAESLKFDQKSLQYKSGDICKFLESKLNDKLKNVEDDESSILRVYLEIFEKIISIDLFGSILDKIRRKIIYSFNNNINIEENEQEKKIKFYQEENKKLKQQLLESESINKNLEAKLKKLSVDNINLYNDFLKIEEENNI